MRNYVPSPLLSVIRQIVVSIHAFVQSRRTNLNPIPVNFRIQERDAPHVTRLPRAYYAKRFSTVQQLIKIIRKPPVCFCVHLHGILKRDNKQPCLRKA